jgi:acyl-CoA thioester hydrolase
VQISDIDAHNYVNNVAYLCWIQDVAVAHWQTEASAEMQKKFTWFVLRHEIDYKKSAFENDEIRATTWVGKASKIKYERFTEIKRDDDILVRSKSIWCLLNTTMNRPTRITLELRELFQMR